MRARRFVARRRSSSRPDARAGRVRARVSLLPAFALLFGALCLFPAAPAQAQEAAQDTVWKATLTAGVTGFGTGCGSATQCASRLTSSSFTHGGVTYQFTRVSFRSQQGIHLDLDKDFSAALKTGKWHMNGGAAESVSLSTASGKSFTAPNSALPGQNWWFNRQVPMLITVPQVTVTDPPGAPVGLAVAPRSARLVVSWTAPAETVTSYDVHYTSSTTVAPDADASGSNPANAWVALSRAGLGTNAQHSISGLTNNTAYRVRVRGVNSVGAGAWAWGNGTPKATVSGSTDASLSALVLSDGANNVTLSPTFSSSTYAYTASVRARDGSVTVTATVNQSNATVKVNGTPAASGEASRGIDLEFGSNTIRVEVTAQAGNTRNYTITVNRPLPRVAWPGRTWSWDEHQVIDLQIRLDVDAANTMVGTLTYAASGTHPASLVDDLGSGRSTGFTMSDGDSYPSSVRIPVVDDALNEENETFTITIEEGTGYKVGSPATITVTINDDDPPPVHQPEPSPPDEPEPACGPHPASQIVGDWDTSGNSAQDDEVYSFRADGTYENTFTDTAPAQGLDQPPDIGIYQ